MRAARATRCAEVLPVGSEHFEIGPVERVSDGALHFGMPGDHEGPEQLTGSSGRDDVEVVKVGHGGAAESSRRPRGTSCEMPRTVVVISATMTFSRYS